MKLSKKQTIALDYLEDTQTNEILFGGSAGGGKSILGCYWLAKSAFKYPNTRWLMGRAKMKTLKETTYQSFLKVAQIQGLKAGTHFIVTAANHKENPNCIVFPNRSVIMMKDLFYYPSDPNFDELGSLELTGAFIDEANQITQKAKSIVRSRIRHRLGENSLVPKLLMTCNPAKNWTFTEFYKPWRDGRLDSSKQFIQSLVTDNPNIEPAYIQNLEQLTDHAIKQRLLFGNWDYDNDPAAICDFDAISDLFTNDHVKGQGQRAISADLAMQGRDRFVAGFAHGNVISVEIDMEQSTGRSIELALKQLKVEKRVPNSRIVADVDGLGNYLESYLTNIKAFRGGRSALKKRDFSNLKSECGFKLAELINKRGLRIVCSPEQEEAIKQELTTCLKRDKIDKDTTRKSLIPKDQMKALLGHSPDYMDMLIMMMIFKISKSFNVKVE